MTARYGMALGVLLLASAGCGVGSVAPIVAERTIHFDARLLGTWRDSSGRESAVVTALDSNRYALVYTDGEGKTGRFNGVLGRVGSYEVLDLLPDDPELGSSDLYKSLLLSLHGGIFIEAIGERLRFRLLEPDSLKAYLQRRPRDIAHLMRDDLVVLTATTEQLQRFLGALVRRPGVLAEANVWIRQAR